MFLILLKCQKKLYTSVVQPIRHSPQVANGHLNVANGSIPKYFIIATNKMKEWNFGAPEKRDEKWEFEGVCVCDN